MFNFFRREQKPQIWLICPNDGPWTKVVTYRKPHGYPLGPFRSEVDAEQAADHLNADYPDCLFYDKDNAPPLEPIVYDEGDEWKAT